MIPTSDGAAGPVALTADQAEQIVRRTRGGAHGLLALTPFDEGNGVKAVAEESLGIVADIGLLGGRWHRPASRYQPLPVREQ